jgi:flagellin
VSLRINTNIQAMTALRSLNQTSGDIQTAMQRLSTGLRVNSASDDPAGLIISETLRTQMRGIDQATRNAQDAINMTKTAEASLEEVQSLIRNMRSIAVHSANTAVVDSNMLRANQSQLRNGLQSINRIAEQTMWGTKKLLDGTAGSQANVTNASNVAGLSLGGMFAN